MGDSIPNELVLLIVLASGALAALLTAGAIYGGYWLLTLPLRRKERARLFLDLLDLGLRQGLTAERVVVAASWSKDRTLGVRFHLLAAELEQGLSLGAALRRVPRLLPDVVVEMLCTGERIGNIGRVLPACRRPLNDGISQVRGALNYLLFLTFTTVPALLLVPLLFTKVWPKWQEIFDGLGERSAMPAFARFTFDHPAIIYSVQACIFGLLALLVLAYIGGPRIGSGLHAVAPRLLGRFYWALPWRRARTRRDFGAMLALLLDSGVPEAEALRLAGECTHSGHVRHRAHTAGCLLEGGVPLPQALRSVDTSPEFQWRLSNAFRARTPVSETLHGWFESLEARAFRYEQTAAQVLSTALLLLNGLIIGSIAFAVFDCLVELTNSAVLW